MAQIPKADVTQAVVVTDCFDDAFVPVTHDIPLALVPLVNKPVLDYTLDFLSFGGIEEVFLLCSSHIGQIKSYISEHITQRASWSLTMKVNIIASESARSFGDCLRDLDARGLIRGHFVLIESGVISNIKLLPLIKKHCAIMKSDKGVAMTLVFQKAGVSQKGRDYTEEVVLASNAHNRILFHKKLGQSHESRIEFPLEIFVDNSTISIHHDLRDAHISICSPSVLPLFTDNFDFQSRDDFVRGLLMNEEILGSTVYWDLVTGNQYGAAVTNWRMYKNISAELLSRWVYPILPYSTKYPCLKKDIFVGSNTSIGHGSNVIRSIIGGNVKIGKNVKIENSFIFSNTHIEDDCNITYSVISYNCFIERQSTISAGCILGKNVRVGRKTCIEGALVQATPPTDFIPENKLGEKAYKIRIDDDSDDSIGQSRYRLTEEYINSSDDSESISGSEDESESDVPQPVLDDTNLFFTEVIDSLTRGYEDQLQCDNLILEINSSRYAYNVSVREVTFNVVKAVLQMSLNGSVGQQNFSYLQRLLLYFSPILTNYIRNETGMMDCLHAIENIAMVNGQLTKEWVMFTIHWFYDKDYLTEDVILEWFSKIQKKSSFYEKVTTFINWLQEAEEASSDDSA